MKKKMTRVIGIVAVLMLLMVACVGAASADMTEVTLNFKVNDDSRGFYEQPIVTINNNDDYGNPYVDEIATDSIDIIYHNENGDNPSIEVTVVIFPGYHLDHYEKNGVKLNDHDSLIDDDVITAVLVADGETVTLSNPEHMTLSGQYSTDGGSTWAGITSGVTLVPKDATVKVTAAEKASPNDYYRVKAGSNNWSTGTGGPTVTSTTDNEMTFTMGDAAVTVTATETAYGIVVYDKNGGTGTAPVDANKYDLFSDAEAKESTGITAPSGKVFSCWNTASEGTGTSVAAGGNYTIEDKGEHKLYAIWVDDIAGDTLFVNDTDTTHMQNLYKDDKGDYYAYKGKDVVIPLYLNGSANHMNLNGYDVQVRATDGTNTVALTTNEVANLLTAWNGDKTVSNNIVSISFSNAAENGTVNISPTADPKTSLLSVKITGDQVTGGKSITLYVEPDKIVETAGNKMFSGFTKDMANLTIADIDAGLFDAANANNLVMTFTVKDLAELTKYTVSDYAGDYTKQDNREPVDLLWEREVNKDAAITATFDSAPTGTVTSWNVTGNAITPYLDNISNPTLSEKTVSGSFVTKGTTAPDSKVSGNMVLTIKPTEGSDITDTHPVTMQKWLSSSSTNHSDAKIGTALTMTLNVMGNQVDTDEVISGELTGWNTYATFPAFGTVMTSGDWKPDTITYKNGEQEVTYGISNGGTEGKMTVGGNLYITSNDVNDSSKTITVTMTGKKLGDATMNGSINIGDSSAMGVDILRANESKLLTGENKLYADVDKSGTIDVTDVQNLNKYLVGDTQKSKVIISFMGENGTWKVKGTETVPTTLEVDKGDTITVTSVINNMATVEVKHGETIIGTYETVPGFPEFGYVSYDGNILTVGSAFEVTKSGELRVRYTY